MAPALATVRVEPPLSLVTVVTAPPLATAFVTLVSDMVCVGPPLLASEPRAPVMVVILLEPVKLP